MLQYIVIVVWVCLPFDESLKQVDYDTCSLWGTLLVSIPAPRLTGDLDLLLAVVRLDDSVDGSWEVEASEGALALEPSAPGI